MTSSSVLFATIGAAAFALLVLRDSATDLTLARLAVAGGALAAAAVIDLREHRVPNRIILPAAAVTAVLAGSGLRHSVAALALVAVLLALALIQPDALGMGDIKAALLIALALGAAAVHAIGLVLAAAAGAVFVVRRGSTALTMALLLAPFLAAGAALAVAVT